MKGIVAARAVVKVIEEEADRNPEFNRRIQSALSEAREKAASRRRSPPVLDVESIVKAEGKDALHKRLEKLTLEQLRDIVSHGSVEPSVMRWKSRERIIRRIVESAYYHAHKGKAFLNWVPSHRRMA